MAEQTSSSEERLDDVFQDEIIIAFSDIFSFKKFARSKNGLCLDQSYIKTIVEDHKSNVQEQKLEILFKWREIQGEKATVPIIRNLLQNYFRINNPPVRTTADESLPRTSKAMTELFITVKVLTGATADESLLTTSKAITEPSITEKVNAIIKFDKSDKHLYSFNLSTKEWRRMQEFPEYISVFRFTTVVSGKHIYFIQKQKVHQLEYSNPAAEWKKMSSMKTNHGVNPSADMLNGLIYVCGSGGYRFIASRSVERYDAALNRWDYMCDMNTARYNPCVVATDDHIYCIGGRSWRQLQSVEIFNERLNKWECVESAPRPIWDASAAVVKNRIYVANANEVLCYDIQNDSWSEINLTIKWPFMKGYIVKILAVDDKLYIIGIICGWIGNRKYAIYLLEPETEQMTLVKEFDDKKIEVDNCLAVKLERNF